MTNRGLEIVRMMGFSDVNAVLEAVGKGELIVLKLPRERCLDSVNWLRAQIPGVRGMDEDLGDTLDEIADGLDFALELERYPVGADVCEMELPNGWPSYCDKDRR